MAKGINKVILIGNLGKDPEVKYLPSGSAVVNVTLATSEQWKDKDSGEKKDRTEWHNLVFYGRVAEIAGEYLKKGSQCYVEGSLRTRAWEKDGVKRYTTEIIVSDMQMLGSRGGSGGTTASYDDEPARASAPRAKSAPASTPGDNDALDDDIPF